MWMYTLRNQGVFSRIQVNFLSNQVGNGSSFAALFVKIFLTPASFDKGEQSRKG